MVELRVFLTETAEYVIEESASHWIWISKSDGYGEITRLADSLEEAIEWIMKDSNGEAFNATEIAEEYFN